MINWNELKIIARYSAEHSNWRLLLDILHSMEYKGVLTYEQRQHVYDILSNNALVRYYGELFDIHELLRTDMEVRIS